MNQTISQFDFTGLSQAFRSLLIALTAKYSTLNALCNDDDQYWYIQNRGNGLKVYSAKSDAQGNSYTLNMNTNTSNCNIYPDIVSNNSDSQVSTVGNESSFRISLARDAFYHVSIDSNSQNVTWGGTMDFTWSLR